MSNKVEFSERIVKKFNHLILNICQQHPKRTLVDVLVQWRGIKELNSTSLEVIHYGSYLVESRPGIGRIPIGGLIFII